MVDLALDCGRGGAVVEVLPSSELGREVLARLEAHLRSCGDAIMRSMALSPEMVADVHGGRVAFVMRQGGVEAVWVSRDPGIPNDKLRTTLKR